MGNFRDNDRGVRIATVALLPRNDTGEGVAFFVIPRPFRAVGISRGQVAAFLELR